MSKSVHSFQKYYSGTVAILVPAFRDQGEATLNNYIPVIIDPTYYWGLVLLALGILILVIRVFKDLSVISDTTTDEHPVLISAGLIYVAALIGAGMAALQLQDQPVNHDYNENLFWGAGHILQLLNVALFLIASSLLYRQAFNSSLAMRAFYTWTSGILVFIGLVGLSLFSIFEVSSPIK